VGYPTRNTAPLLAFLASSALLLACERAPSADALHEWTPQDHHSVDDQRAGQQQKAQPAQPPANNAGGGSDVASLVDLTWRTQCTACHGPMGRGDGQMGPMLHAPDLTRADWQSHVTDAELAATIKGGKGKMPKFDLPDPVVQGLVARIRQLRAPAP
jgi:cytochrome c oxidase cbb3-type subunit 3